ncbi:MAG: NAD(P)-dependent oxidoreductase [Chloroflexota bacterium]
MRVLVTGSSGHIGSAVAAYVRQSADVVGLDVRPGAETTVVGSIEDRPLLQEIVPNVDGIIHCAAFLTPHVGVVPEDRFTDVNVHGTENLLNLAVQHGVERFVFTSTTSVYGCSTRPKTEAIWVTEELEPAAEDIYDQTKLAAEALCAEASKSGLQTAVMRMSRCFPEPDHLMPFYRLYRGVARQDVAQAHWLGLQADFGDFEIFNISGDSPFQPTDCRELLNDPWAVIDRYFPDGRSQYEQLGWELPGRIDRVYVIEKAKRMLGFHPTESFSDLLDQHIASQNK